jgi:hypothetical protein
LQTQAGLLIGPRRAKLFNSNVSGWKEYSGGQISFAPIIAGREALGPEEAIFNRFHTHPLSSTMLEATMKVVQTIVLISGSALSAFRIFRICGDGGPTVLPEHYCLSYDKGGTDCGFAGYPQCLETASGIPVECYDKTVRDDQTDRAYIPHW